MTRAEMIDYVEDFLTKQGRKSHEGTRCLYFGPDDTRCAIGCLLTDADIWLGHDKRHNTKVLTSIWHQLSQPSRERLLIDDEKEPDYGFLSELQGIHDHSHDTANFASNLKYDMNALRKRYGIPVREA